MEKNYLQCITNEGRSSREYAVTVLLNDNREISGFVHKRHFKDSSALEVTVIGVENEKALVIFPRGLKIDQGLVEIEKLMM
jgi:hypothetical protein